MSNIEPHGYKPQIVCGLLGISDQTLRYWRSTLIPNGHKAFFSGRDLFSLKILTVLIQELGFDVEDLRDFRLNTLFKHCHTASIDNLSKSILLIDRKKSTIFFTDNEEKIDKRNRAQVTLYMDDLQKELFDAMIDYGINNLH